MLGIKIATKIIAPFVKVKIDKTDSTCFDFNNDTLIIGYDFNDDEYGFMRHLREVHGCKFANFFTHRFWAILHELGHYFTGEGIEDEKETLEVRALCILIGDDIVKTNKGVQDMYFNLPSEFAATEWAINFIKTHKWLSIFLNRVAQF